MNYFNLKHHAFPISSPSMGEFSSFIIFLSRFLMYSWVAPSSSAISDECILGSSRHFLNASNIFSSVYFCSIGIVLHSFYYYLLVSLSIITKEKVYITFISNKYR